MQAEKPYFQGLDALRFFAATLVIFHHIEQYKYWSGKESLWGNGFIDSLGHNPVSFFFVLSGFLITYLLLNENDKQGKINIPFFYLKRILRIWPLYFLIALIALFIVPLFSDNSFSQLPVLNDPLSLFALLFMLPNLLRVSFPTLIGANQLWSVGIEEQFYAFWPLLIRNCISKIEKCLLVFIGLKMSGELFLVALDQIYSQNWIDQLLQLYLLFPVEQLAIGGLGAAFLFNENQKMLKLMSSKIAAITCSLLLVWWTIYPIHFYADSVLKAVAFLIIILQVIKNPIIYKPLENRLLKHLGNISYGIYMWHCLVIAGLITIFDLVNWQNDLLLTISVVVLTVLVSHFSFSLLERPFLKLKSVYALRSRIRNKKSIAYAKP